MTKKLERKYVRNAQVNLTQVKLGQEQNDKTARNKSKKLKKTLYAIFRVKVKTFNLVVVRW